MKVKFILPSLLEAEDNKWRPIKYSLFPPLGLATLAAYLDENDEAEIVDQHVQPLDINDHPDLVAIEVYITNAYRAYHIADHYRSRGVTVILGGLHVTSLPDEAAQHADAIFLGPAEHSFPQFLRDFRRGNFQKRYLSGPRTLAKLPPIRRDLIQRQLYLVPNSIVVSRGCPYHCDFCYKDAFFQNGKSFYVQEVDDALQEIARLPGRHLYFLDDHLLGNRQFAHTLFEGMQGMNRIFQAAATVESIMRGSLIEKAVDAGLRSIFVGFESLSPQSLRSSNKHQNLNRNYGEAIKRLHDLGVMINGSFVFGLDGDDPDIFDRTVDWAVEMGITTCTFHIATPYPGTRFFQNMEKQGRIATYDWNLYNTRHVVFKPHGMTPAQLQAGCDHAYRNFYSWRSILRASLSHDTIQHRIKHFLYTSAWRKFEPVWNIVIQMRQLNMTTPMVEAILGKTSNRRETFQLNTQATSPIIQDEKRYQQSC